MMDYSRLTLLEILEMLASSLYWRWSDKRSSIEASEFPSVNIWRLLETPIKETVGSKVRSLVSVIEASTPFGEAVNLCCGGEEEIEEQVRWETRRRSFLTVVIVSDGINDTCERRVLDDVSWSFVNKNVEDKTWKIT